MDRQHLDCLLKQRLNFLAGHAALPFEDVLRKEDVPATQPSHRRRIAAPIAAAFTMGLGVLVLLTQAGPWALRSSHKGYLRRQSTIVAENSPTVPVVGLSAPLRRKSTLCSSEDTASCSSGR
ncbi:MAG: hypothetical protein R3C68_06965 [Myxococcota bacterium]